MSIPPLSPQGFLPPGIHDASLDEIEARFGRFSSNERRVELFNKLRQYLAELSAWGHIKEVLIDGSFVSSKDCPNDIDMIVVYKEDFDIAAEVTPSEYNCLKSTRVRALYGFDVFAVLPGDVTYQKMKAFFEQDTAQAGLTKGLVRVAL
jgi:hypothetical protein